MSVATKSYGYSSVKGTKIVNLPKSQTPKMKEQSNGKPMNLKIAEI